jgi:hypothetical protein
MAIKLIVDRQIASLTAQCRQVYCLVEMAPSDRALSLLFRLPPLLPPWSSSYLNAAGERRQTRFILISCARFQVGFGRQHRDPLPPYCLTIGHDWPSSIDDGQSWYEVDGGQGCESESTIVQPSHGPA